MLIFMRLCCILCVLFIYEQDYLVLLISQKCKIAAKVHFFPHIRKKKTIYFSSEGRRACLCGLKNEYSAGFFQCKTDKSADSFGSFLQKIWSFQFFVVPLQKKSNYHETQTLQTCRFASICKRLHFRFCCPSSGHACSRHHPRSAVCCLSPA